MGMGGLTKCCVQGREAGLNQLPMAGMCAQLMAAWQKALPTWRLRAHQHAVLVNDMAELSTAAAAAAAAAT